MHIKHNIVAQVHARSKRYDNIMAVLSFTREKSSENEQFAIIEILLFALSAHVI